MSLVFSNEQNPNSEISVKQMAKDCLKLIIEKWKNQSMRLVSLVLLWVCWHRTTFRAAVSHRKIIFWVRFVYQQSDVGIEPRMAGWEVQTLPLCYAVPLCRPGNQQKNFRWICMQRISLPFSRRHPVLNEKATYKSNKFTNLTQLSLSRGSSKSYHDRHSTMFCALTRPKRSN